MMIMIGKEIVQDTEADQEKREILNIDIWIESVQNVNEAEIGTEEIEIKEIMGKKDIETREAGVETETDEIEIRAEIM